MSCSNSSQVTRCRPGWRFLCLGLALALVLTGARLSAQQDLEQRINAAIHRGRAALLPRLAEHVETPPGDQPMGKIALLLAACLKAQVPTTQDIVRRALAKLETIEPTQTYSVACYLFALDAYWQTLHGERRVAPAKSGSTMVQGGAVPRLPPEDDPIRRKMVALVAWLVRGEGGSWTYQQRGGGDLSNTQFAVLGLEIGLQNAIPVPTEVFRAVAERLIKAFHPDGTPVALGIVYRTAAWEGVTRGRTRPMMLKVEPGGWGYHFNPQENPTPNMTAAGVSSLLVARRALVTAGEYDTELALKVDRLIDSGLAWMFAAFPRYLGSNYYGTYSLEKVGDIGSIQAFGHLDWYLEGARHLLRAQDKNGSWGTEIDTSFALLFLTRATRSPIQTLGPPVLLTNDNDPTVKAETSDLVFIARLSGFVSAATLFGFLRETRDPAVLPFAEEAAKAFPPHRIDEVFQYLLPLWTNEDDAVTTHARKALSEISGVKSGNRDVFDRLGSGLRRMRGLERKGVDNGSEAAELLESSDSPLLVRRALDFVDRLGLLEAFPAVISKLTSTDADVSRRCREVLTGWAGDSGPRIGDKDPPATVQSAWRDWWQRQGSTLVASRRASKLIEDIDQSTDAFAQDAAAKGLSKLGQDAVPHILNAMNGGEYSLHLIRVLENITGKTAGVRLEDWRKALAGTK